MLLVLDLDETLIHACEQPMTKSADFQIEDYHVYKRPDLNHFLDFCFELFEVAVWTSGGPQYAKQICQQLFTKQAPLLIWALDKCTPRFDPESMEYIPVKN